MSLDLQPDIDLNGSVWGNGDAPALAADWNREWLIPANTNTWFPVKIFKDVALSGTYTLALSGSADIAARYGDVTIHGGESAAVPFPSVASQETVGVQASDPGSATLIVSFAGTGAATNYVCGTHVDITAVAVTLEPVTVEVNAQGTIVNPCGVAVNGLAAYHIRVEPTAAVPDNAIHWSVASGSVTFYSGNSTGRDVIIRGGVSEPDFKLEVEIDGLPLAVKPYIHGRVLEPKTVPINAYIICSNGVPAITTSTISGWIAEANRIYRQVAVTFTLAGVTTVTDHPDWFDIGDSTEFYQMTSYTKNTGGLELYCVNFIISGVINGLHSDRQLPYGNANRGMAVRADAPKRTFAHESGHACGLPDLYTYGVVAGFVSEDKVKPLNWSGGEGTGYHPPGLLYRDVMFRTLMHNHDGTDIPLDRLTGIDGGIPVPVSVGLNQMTTREPQH